jgi:hypothetical protein
MSQGPNLIETKPRWKRYSHSTSYLVILSAVGSLVLSAYVLVVSSYLVHLKGSDALEKSALKAASLLANLTIHSTAFGAVGICDQLHDLNSAVSTSAPKEYIRGINSVYAKMRAAALVAHKLKNQQIFHLLNDDFSEARLIESKLSEKTRIAIQRPSSSPSLSPSLSGALPPNQANGKDNFIYATTFRDLAQAARKVGSRLVDLEIKLGFVGGQSAQTAVLAPDHSPSTEVDDNGFYKAGVPINVPDFPPIMFTTSPAKTQLIPHNYFVEDQRVSVPAAILIKATFEESTKDKPGQTSLVPKIVCAVIGNRASAHNPSALVIDFPQGAPTCFQSAAQILEHSLWRNSGVWRSSAKPLPNDQVSKRDLSASSMTPDQAFAIALYHWLKTLPSNTDPDRCLSLLNSKLCQAQPVPLSTIITKDYRTNQRQSVVNSCLAQDTEGRTLSFLNQEPDGNLGQLSFDKRIDDSENSTGVLFNGAPPSALPLQIDHSGACHLSGCASFDQALVERFFASVYDTNLAALESLAVARQARDRATDDLEHLRPKLLIEKQEWSSITNRLKRQQQNLAQSESPDRFGDDSESKERLNKKFGITQKALISDERELAKLNLIIRLSRAAEENAQSAINFTYNITANAFTVCRNGLVALDDKTHGFVIGKKFLFVPISKPLSEFDFDEATNRTVEEAGRNPNDPILADLRLSLPENNSADWLKENLKVGIDLDSSLKNTTTSLQQIEPILRAVLKQPPQGDEIAPTIVVLDSQMVLGKAPSSPLMVNSYPFAGTILPAGQRVYFCQDALRTGKAPKISWSVVVKDLAANYLEGNFGEPVRSSEEDWCRRKGQALGACPGLISEFQLRSPLPVLKGLRCGSIVRNEAGREVFQVPPLPVDTL